MYNNPFMYQSFTRPSFISRLLGRGVSTGAGINWGNILSNTQKSLGIVNQAIPLVQQVKPMVNNAKAMFKIANILKDDKPSVHEIREKTTSNTSNKPIFYI